MLSARQRRPVGRRRARRSGRGRRYHDAVHGRHVYVFSGSAAWQAASGSGATPNLLPELSSTVPKFAKAMGDLSPLPGRPRPGPGRHSARPRMVFHCDNHRLDRADKSRFMIRATQVGQLLPAASGPPSLKLTGPRRPGCRPCRSALVHEVL